MELENSDPLPSVELNLKPCPVCARTFLPDVLERHSKICAKVNLKRRKIFDSSKQRAIGGEVRENKEVKTRSSGLDSVKSHQASWKEKHHQLINTIRNARRSAPTTSMTPDYIHCPGCERHFSPKVAESHIVWCRAKMARIPPSPAPASMEAMERLKARTKYRPPPPNTISTSNHRRRSSGSGNTLTNDDPSCHSEDSRPIRSAISHRAATLPLQPRMTHSSPAELESSRRHFCQQTVKNPQSKSSSKNQTPAVVKFKEKFPNRTPSTLSNVPDQKEYDPYKQADIQMQDLIDSLPPPEPPKTVPGRHLNNAILASRNKSNARTKQNNQNEINFLRSRIANLSTTTSNDICAAGDNLNSCLGDSNSQNDVVNNNHINANKSNSPVNNHEETPFSQSESKNDDDGPNVLSLAPASNCHKRMPRSHYLQPKGPWSEEPLPNTAQRLPHYCHQCGTRFPISTAKYCCECGYRRFGLPSS